MRRRLDNSKLIYHNKRGFSLAELMMAVAIIGILAGVSFIAVANYMRSMEYLERNAIAKEIFVAAQNHLTVAESQGYFGISEFGNLIDNYQDKSGKTIAKSYYIRVDENTSFSANSMIDQMLPFGSIDETVRAGGSYIIHYEREPARILNVFYFGNGSNSRDYYNDLAGFCSNLVGNIADFSVEGSVVGKKYGDNRAVIGYFGEKGAESIDRVTVEAPVIEVNNTDRLYVKITNPNVKITNPNNDVEVKIRLIVKGQTSGNEVIKRIMANNSTPDSDLQDQLSDLQDQLNHVTDGLISSSVPDIIYVMDDITTENYHFYNLFSEGVENGLDPGEEISVVAEAEAADSGVFSNIASSAEYIVNSLYATHIEDVPDTNSSNTGGVTTSSVDSQDDNNIAYIGYIRHLENLDNSISHVEKGLYTKAQQIADLSWKDFLKEINGSDAAYVYDVYGKESSNGGFYPVDLYGNVSYDGAFKENNGSSSETVYYQISDIKVATGATTFENAGLFGKLMSDTSDSGNSDVSVKNLKLVDFAIENKDGYAGALVGQASGYIFDNIVVFNTKDFDNEINSNNGDDVSNNGSNNNGDDVSNNESNSDSDVNSKKSNVKSQGTAGGLFGKVSGGSITKCAAALTVQGRTAGGFAGEASGCEISSCYAGGHTENGMYYLNSSEKTEGNRIDNVIGTYSAGGFVGHVSGGVISDSYSTCSASGGTVGGFIGFGSPNSIIGCYATGLVSGSKPGAFAGDNLSGASNCWYYEIINEEYDEESTDGYVYLKGGPEKDITGVKALDEDTDLYNRFMDSVLSGFLGGSNSREAVTYDETLGSVYFGYSKSDSENNTTGSDNNDEDSASGEMIYVEKHYGDWPTPEILVINESSESGLGGGETTGGDSGD